MINIARIDYNVLKLVHSVSEGQCRAAARVQYQQPRAKTAEVKAHGDLTYFWFVVTFGGLISRGHTPNGTRASFSVLLAQAGPRW